MVAPQAHLSKSCWVICGHSHTMPSRGSMSLRQTSPCLATALPSSKQTTCNLSTVSSLIRYYVLSQIYAILDWLFFSLVVFFSSFFLLFLLSLFLSFVLSLFVSFFLSFIRSFIRSFFLSFFLSFFSLYLVAFLSFSSDPLWLAQWSINFTRFTCAITMSGGTNGFALGDMWILDPNSLAWLRYNKRLRSGKWPPRRFCFGNVLVNQRYLYIFGGGMFVLFEWYLTLFFLACIFIVTLISCHLIFPRIHFSPPSCASFLDYVIPSYSHVPLF